ncbi:MAG: hypothetical protein ACLP01_29240 [Solirubrobacteraceae bacterium]
MSATTSVDRLRLLGRLIRITCDLDDAVGEIVSIPLSGSDELNFSGSADHIRRLLDALDDAFDQADVRADRRAAA